MSGTPASMDSFSVASPLSSDFQGRKRTSSEQGRELQAKMQDMISLQYQAQQHQSATGDEDQEAPKEEPEEVVSVTKTPRSSLALPWLQQNSSGRIEDDEIVQAPHPSVRGLDNARNQHQQEMVGKGTLLFSGNLKSSMGMGAGTATSSMSSLATPPRPPWTAVAPAPIPDKQQQQQLQKLQQHLSPQISGQAPHLSNKKMVPGPAGLTRSQPMQQLAQEQQQQQLLQPMSPPPQQIYAGYGSLENQHRHDFHYGDGSKPGDEANNDNSNDEDDEYDDGNLKGLLLHDLYNSSRHSLPKTFCQRICSCWRKPLLLFSSQDNLNRSFCYGSVDGLLTGSGIVAAMMGLGVLHSGSSQHVRLAVVALATAACLADALAMALGHVWNTYFVVSSHADERTQERLLLEQNKAEAKSKLVDLLLSRAGMLKIDAMSLADTLEGYPDLFVNALVGDSLLATDDGGYHGMDDEVTEDGGDVTAPNPYGSPSGGGGRMNAAGGQQVISAFGSWKFPSHGQFHKDIMHFDTPEASYVNFVFRESQKEGCFMMMGFALFAILPSLLWLVLPMWIGPVETLEPSSSSSSSKSSTLMVDDAVLPPPTGQTVSLPSLIIFILGVVVWLLGVWKSRFVDSNWAIFGVESVSVLLVCVLSAYGVAALFVHCMIKGVEGGTSSDDDAALSLLGLNDL